MSILAFMYVYELKQLSLCIYRKENREWQNKASWRFFAESDRMEIPLGTTAAFSAFA
ncbi:hypothetical protein MPL3365_30080 [Mesorhizobium plurifarium]|uniref:Uncharacterized protein n=1 Tax=Mesorhizobium plurifarium TaxID=69974 RepID=A0A090GDT7_MESPL|nr:hypothetical protein MPL3365_30080 [Mesorhizobium plurifarium]